MPKMKNQQDVSKRQEPRIIKEIKHKSHILTKKSTKRKRNLRQATITDSTNAQNMKKILPYL